MIPPSKCFECARDLPEVAGELVGWKCGRCERVGALSVLCCVKCLREHATRHIEGELPNAA